MKNTLNEFVDSVMAGSPIRVEAKKAGVFPEQLRRAVQKHPDYAKAKSEGRLHPPGLPGAPELDPVLVGAAVADVVAGMTVTDAAVKHGMAVSTLTKKVHQANPGIDLPKGGAGGKRDAGTRLASAQAAVERCRKALSKAEQELLELSTSTVNFNLTPIPTGTYSDG